MVEFQSSGIQPNQSKEIIRNTTIVVPVIAEPENNNDLFDYCEQGNTTIKLNYQLLSLFSYQPDSESYQTLYSILVNKIKDDIVIESDILYDISRDDGKANDLYELLMKNTVTPLTLREITEDILAI